MLFAAKNLAGLAGQAASAAIMQRFVKSESA